MTVRILQSHLSEIGEAFLTGNFDQFLNCVALPLEVITRRANLWLESEEMLEESFTVFTDTLWALGVDRIERRAVSVTGMTNRCIFGRYASCWMCKAEKVSPLYTANITLEHQVQCWKTTSLALQTDDMRLPLMPPHLLTV